MWGRFTQKLTWHEIHDLHSLGRNTVTTEKGTRA